MHEGFSTGQLLALLAPIAVIELAFVALMAFALRDLVKRKRVKGGSKWLWAAIIIFFQMFGPIIYLVFGRVEESQ